MSDTVALALPTPHAASLAFDELYRSSATDVFAYAASILRDRAAAEEVTAQAFERAFRRRKSFDPRRGNARAWLFGIARNAALDELRRRRRTAALVADPEDLSAPAALADDDPDAAARRATVRAALAALEPRDRELIALKFHAGLSNAEIALVLRTSESNAGTRLHRALTRLREACHVAP
jgi:RNA polymerase sigma-70 factor, ECF subfamily